MNIILVNENDECNSCKDQNCLECKHSIGKLEDHPEYKQVFINRIDKILKEDE